MSGDLSIVAATSASPLFVQVLPWLAVLTALVVIGALILYVLRRRLTSDSSAPEQGFTLHELRAMHASGDLSDEEFERARGAMLEQYSPSAGSAEQSTDAGDPDEA